MLFSFTDYLHHFALSVDIVNEETLEELRNIIDKFLTKLQFDFYEVQIDGMLAGGKEPSLTTVLTKGNYWTNGNHSTNPITKNDGSYIGHTGYAYGEKKSLWVTGKEGKPLAKAEEFIDSWSNLGKELPPYWDYSSIKHIKTEIIMPLLRSNKICFGIINIESKKLLPYSQYTSNELHKLQEAISRVLSLEQTNKLQFSGTKKALERISYTLEKQMISPLQKPRIFFAYSSSADNKIVGIIREVLDKYAERLDIVSWGEGSETGNINFQLLKDISTCQYGVCYFSEPSGKTFKDNANVLFEAGMLHALTNEPDKKPIGWIPIRESSSPKPPFDFAAERTITVKRVKKDNTRIVNESKLKSELCNRIENLVLFE